MEATGSAADAAGETRITVVTSGGCHLCADALAALADLGRDYRLTVAEVAAASPAGQELLAAHGIGMFPMVLVDGAWFSAGRLPRRKLARLLDRRVTAGGRR